MRKLKRCLKEVPDYYFIVLFYLKKWVTMHKINKTVKREEKQSSNLFND